jgi:serine/threonine protein phosphatase PrpC
MPITVASAQGLRDYQEDRSFTYESELGTVIAVFDGHGGERTAEWLGVNLPSILIEELAVNEPKLALEKTFKRADEATRQNHAGSTATVAFIPNDKLTAYIAVLGDSPVIAKFASGLRHVSPEHNVRTNLVEREAAEERGGIYAGGYICRGFSGPGLQMGRAFGDSNLGKIISKEPEVYDIPLGDWLLVCSDGVTDPGHGNMADAVAKIEALIEAGGDAKTLVDRATRIPTGDNATAILWRR